MECNIKCSYCDAWFEKADACARHCIQFHKNENVSFLQFSSKDGQLSYKCRTYKLSGEDLTCDPKQVSVSDDSGKMIITPEINNEGQVNKKIRVNESTKSVHRQIFNQLNDDTDQHTVFECIDNENDEVQAKDEVIKKAVLHMTNLLPSVTAHLAEAGRLSEWMSFFNLVSSNEFNVSHISLQLFLDVIKFATIGDASAMRYSAEVKEFWTVGQSMFKPKFIRFMGGYKTVTNNDCSTAKPCKLKADISALNFVCPHNTIISEHRRSYNINCDKPGLITSNIDAIANVLPLASKRFNLCVDGKKIVPGFGKHAGEVDLFGNEFPPTLQEKQNRLEVELMCLSSLTDEINKWIDKDVDILSDIATDTKIVVRNQLLDLVSIITERIKEIRIVKVNRQLTYDKLIKMGGEQWQKSKYSLAISSIKTQMYSMNMLIENGLEINKNIGFLIAACNGIEYLYSLENVVDLHYQDNYVCLKDGSKVEGFKETELPTMLTKQRTEFWFEQRKQAKVTGSTLNKAIGLSTLKEQREHYDKVMKGTKKAHNKEMNNNIKLAMEHGVKNEINAIGVLAATILPVYEPSCMLHEEGFYKIPSGTDPNFFIVSPDGSCRSGNGVEAAVEIKCPVPGKKYTPDVHYTMPKYYVGQCLAEMAALKSEKLYYLSWTPESTTVLKADFDNQLWNVMKTELLDVYNNENKPTKTKLGKKRPAVQQLAKSIANNVHEKVTLIGEFPSTVSINCRHEQDCDLNQIQDLNGYHSLKEKFSNKTVLERVNNSKRRYLTPQAMQTLLKKSEQCVNEMYNVLRVPAKEVIVGVLSDLDRTSGPSCVHGVPISYGLSGYSLKVESLRSMVDDILEFCTKKDIHIKSISTDGQFYRICVRSASGEPLTILQVAKDTWERVKKKSKVDQIQQLMQLNHAKHESDEATLRSLDISLLEHHDIANDQKQHGPIVVKGWKGQKWQHLYNPPKLKTLLQAKEKKKDLDQNSNENINYDNLPLEAVVSLQSEIGVLNEDDQETVTNFTITKTANVDLEQEIQVETNDVTDEDNVNDFITECNVNQHVQNEMYTQIDVNCIREETLSTVVESLKCLDVNRKKPKWARLDTSKLKNLLKTDPSLLMKSLTKNELIECVILFKGQTVGYKKAVNELSKVELVNAVSVIFGNKCVIGPKKSPKPLRQLLREYFTQTVNKESLNAITATHLFLEEELPKWRRNSVFKDGIQVGPVGQNVDPYMWYSQPDYFQSAANYIVFLLDCHHLFVNARSYVCQHDIPGLNVSREAWVEVAQSPESAEIGLNQAMVVDVIDKQSNAIAQIVFSAKLEDKMKELGWVNESIFCKHMRNWYMAEDEPGLTVDERHQLRMNMRTYLLNAVNLAEFPPPGLHVAGMPIVMFEGILTNIDRRIQLYALLPGNAYNVRAPNTLAVENLFGGFQDLDPKSSGVLLADDVSHALATASYLIQMRLNPERYMLKLADLMLITFKLSPIWLY